VQLTAGHEDPKEADSEHDRHPRPLTHSPTVPGHLAQGGRLTSSVPQLVDHARQSVTCSTFNFQRSSGLWEALRRAALRPELTVRVYLDTAVADQQPKPRSPTTTEVAAQLRPGAVLRTKDFDGRSVRNHAKFLAIDHRFLLVTSATSPGARNTAMSSPGCSSTTETSPRPSSARCCTARTCSTNVFPCQLRSVQPDQSSRRRKRHRARTVPHGHVVSGFVRG